MESKTVEKLIKLPVDILDNLREASVRRSDWGSRGVTGSEVNRAFREKFERYQKRHIIPGKKEQ